MSAYYDKIGNNWGQSIYVKPHIHRTKLSMYLFQLDLLHLLVC